MKAPITPRADDSTFVLFDRGVARGTAVAVSETLLLTAGHCVKPNRVYRIAHKCSLASGAAIYTNHAKVMVVAVNADRTSDSTDYAVLELSRKSPFKGSLTSLTPLPIYTGLVAKEMYTKSYSAHECDKFNSLGKDEIGVGVHSYEKINYVSAHHLFIDHGLLSGCSGGPYVVLEDGVLKLMGLHIESENDIPEPELPDDPDDLASHVHSLHDAMTTAANTHASSAKGLIINRCQALCAYLRGRGVAV